MDLGWIGSVGLSLGAAVLVRTLVRSRKRPFKVLKVIDGDTFIGVMPSGKKERVRLLGCDCPELDQKLGPECRDYVASLIEGRWTTVRAYGKDRYGRRLVNVVAPVPLTPHLLKLGMAWPMPGQLSLAAWNARLSRRGVWGLPRRQKPWESASRRNPWRRNLRRLLHRWRR